MSLAPIGAGLHHHLTLLRFTDVSGEPCWLAGQPALAIRAGGGRLDLRIDPVPARTSAEQAALQQQLSGYATAVPDGARLRLTASTPVLALLDIETYGDCDLREDIHDGQRWTVAGAHLRGSLELRGVSSDICSRSRVHVSPVLRQGRLAIPSRQFETPDQTSRP